MALTRIVRCAPLEECPLGDRCQRLRGRPQDGDQFHHFGPPPDGKKCNFFVSTDYLKQPIPKEDV